MSGVGRFHLVPYGVTIVGPCRSDGAGGYGGGPAPVCSPCLGHGTCGRLEGGGWVCQVECLEAYGGVQDPFEVVRQARDRERAYIWGDGRGVIATWEEGWRPQGRPPGLPLTRSRGGPATGRCGDTHK